MAAKGSDSGSGSGKEIRSTPVPTVAQVTSKGISGTRDIFQFGASLLNELFNEGASCKKTNTGVRVGHMMLRAVDVEQKRDGMDIKMS